MSAVDNSGPAFPSWEGKHYTDQRPHGGMTLRDYFAGRVVCGAFAGMGIELNGKPFPSGEAAELALLSYQIADAMLKARQA